MDSTTPSTRTAADRWCNAWAFLCAGALLGFGLAIELQSHGYSPFANSVLFQMILLPVGLLVIALPRMLLEIGRLVAKHRKLEKYGCRSSGIDPRG
jgi:hypothetical protein